MVVTRRCNLSCGYCNEYDDHSPPVDTTELIRRVDAVADAGTVVLTLTGGEPLLHPDLGRIVRHAVSSGLVCTTITNGYTITRRRIDELNHAGLTLLQVSIDNLEPNEMSQKSWTRLKDRLKLLREHAHFKITVNAVLGSCSPGELRRLSREAREMGFYMTVGLMHDARGQLDAGLLGSDLDALYQEIRSLRRKSLFHRIGEGWERKVIRERTAPWKCRAGGRYLYVDENGGVSYCSQRRGEPGIPLDAYTKEDRKRESHTPKGCENRCTISCVRRASAIDSLRSQKCRAAVTPAT